MGIIAVIFLSLLISAVESLNDFSITSITGSTIAEMEAQAMIVWFNATGSATKRAYVMTNLSDVAAAYLPSTTILTLHHFCLIYESPNYVMASNQYADRPISGCVALVKSFEYVLGAVINGDGIIEVNVVTNNGRTFTYHQENVDGRFVVPCSTINNQYDMKTAGSCTIVDIDKIFEISEEAVMRVFIVN